MTDSRDTRLAKARERAERREPIAAGVFALLMMDAGRGLGRGDVEGLARDACSLADILLAELDACRAAEEAQA